MLRLVTQAEVPGPPAMPGPRECVVCFVERMTRAYGCGNWLTWALRWRDERAPRATALAERLGRMGGYCDCEVLMNAYARPDWLAAESREWDEEQAVDPAVDLDDPEPPPCAGVRGGSTQACRHWLRRPRAGWW